MSDLPRGRYLPMLRAPAPAWHRLDSVRSLIAAIALWLLFFAASLTQLVILIGTVLILTFGASLGAVIAAIYELTVHPRAMPSVVALAGGVLLNPAFLPLLVAVISILIAGNPGD